MTQKAIEKKALIITVIVNTIITGAGIWVFLATKMNALFLDCFFSFAALLSTVFAAIISKISKKKTRHYPDGIYFLEALYAILKSLLTLSLLIVAATSAGISAFDYFSNGKETTMNIAPVKVLFSAFRKLSGGTVCDGKIQKTISETLEKYLNGDVTVKKYDVYKIGTKIKVQVHLKADSIENGHQRLIILRAQILKELLQRYESIEMAYLL